MILKLSLLLLSLIALIVTFRTNSRYTNIIVVGMVAAVILVQFPGLVIPGIILYMGFVAAAFAYGLLLKDKPLIPKIIISVMAASMFLYWLWMLNHWHGNTLLFPVLALLTGIVGLVYKKDLKPQWGFLLILWVDALDSVIEILLKSL